MDKTKQTGGEKIGDMENDLIKALFDGIEQASYRGTIKAFETINKQAQPETSKKVFRNTDEAVEYINERGVPIAKSTLYKHTMEGTIQFQRFGKKLMFKSEDLDKWIKERLSGSDRYDMIKKVADSAKRKAI